MKKVLIVGNSAQYETMFLTKGWERTRSLGDADLVQFTGGEDVTPSLYGHGHHPQTHNNPLRDEREKLVFYTALSKNVPMAGICRGGQFLNVMCGGKMFQHVDGHCRSHTVRDEETGEIFQATSTHHQMMQAAPTGKVVAVGCRATLKERCAADGKIIRQKWNVPSWEDTEVVFYSYHGTTHKDMKVLCFQPHPEFSGEEKLADVYFGYLKKYLSV